MEVSGVLRVGVFPSRTLGIASAVPLRKKSPP
jgi:hypothetical protein